MIWAAQLYLAKNGNEEIVVLTLADWIFFFFVIMFCAAMAVQIGLGIKWLIGGLRKWRNGRATPKPGEGGRTR